MTSSSHTPDGIENVRRDARRYGLIFVQLGTAHMPVRHDLLTLGDAKVSALDLLEGSEVGSGLIVVDKLEALGSAGADMSRLRGLVLDGMDQGRKYVLVSSFPKSRFDRVPGSSLLLDARTTVLPLGDFGSGSDDSSGVWPACASDDSTVEQVARGIFDDLGLDIAASLDHVIYESFATQEKMINRLSEREIEALYCAGLLRREDAGYQWAIRNRFAEIRNALAHTLASAVAPQEDLALVFAELWTVERTLRQRLRSRLEEIFGKNWRSQSLHGDLGPKVLGRACEDVYAGAKSLKELRDPLEWLTLGELLEVRKGSGVGNLGIEPVVWEKFKREVTPVRNRVSHMRLLRSGDLDVVRQWRAIIARKLQ